jgi:hypothetical protein
VSAVPAACRRAFLVGCPRSGTTLLQSLIAAHPEAVSFPETFFFAKVVPRPPHRWRRRLGFASTEAPEALRDLDALGVPDDPAPPSLPTPTIHGYAQRFVRRMDRAAHDATATLWLEKTPSHARHIARITGEVPDARFVHLIRAGESVAASLRSAGDSDPEVWNSSTALQLVQVWRRYLGYSQPWIGQPNHVFVSYERLVAEAGAVMGRLFGFLGISSDAAAIEQVLSGYSASSERVVGRVIHSAGQPTLQVEPWKLDVSGQIDNRNDLKFRELFTQTEQAEVSAAVRREQALVASFPCL